MGSSSFKGRIWGLSKNTPNAIEIVERDFADSDDRWNTVAMILLEPILLDIEASVVESSTKAPPDTRSRRIIYGSCPRCHGEVKTLADGEPLCLRCGWAGQTTPGEEVQRLPEGTPLTYERSIELVKGLKDQRLRYRQRQKDKESS